MKPNEFTLGNIPCQFNLKDGASRLYIAIMQSHGETWLRLTIKIIHEQVFSPYDRYVQIEQEYHLSTNDTGHLIEGDMRKREAIDFIYRNVGLMTQHFNSGGLPATWNKI